MPPELIFYGVIALIACLVALSRRAERQSNTRKRLLTASGVPTWAVDHGLTPRDGGQKWAREDGLRVEVSLDREANGRQARLVSLEVVLDVDDDLALPFGIESSTRPSDSRAGHPTLARWYTVDGDPEVVLASANARFADGLIALKDDEPAFSSVRARGATLACSLEAKDVTEEELGAVLDRLLGHVRAIGKAWPRQTERDAMLDALLRDPSEPDEVRWRAVMYLLTRHPGTSFARRAFEDRESWPDTVRSACLIWGGEAREFSEEERYVLRRDASRHPDAELAQAAGRELSLRSPWRALVDARVGLGARLACAPRALSDPDLPEREGVVDDALVGVLTGMLPEESARVPLYGALMEGGWAPSAAARLKLVERGTPELNAAIMAHVEAVGATAEDADALEALRAEGFGARVDAALALARDQSGKDGMLTLSEDEHDRGALTQTASEGGELTPSDPS